MVSVIGGSEASPCEREFAFTLGKLLAGEGHTVVCGGGSGVMEEVARGCKLQGGNVIGVLPGESAAAGNGYLTFALPTGLGVSRNRIIALSGSVVCAVGGAWGTLSEIAFALQAGKPVCGYGRWSGLAGVEPVGTPMEAVEFVKNRMEE